MGDLHPGATIAGRFVLDELLGQGGMGVVWAATHAITRRPVALKFLKPDKAGDPQVRERFLREARAASAVAHPNIIEIRDLLELEDGTPVMVMDLLRGESLGSRLEREKTIPLDALAPIMLQVLSAVGTAHAAGVVHRDLKPDNIFLVSDAGPISVRVLDFGIAKILSPGGELEMAVGLTGTGALVGTPFYMAPEQIYGERDIDQRADVWALGVMLYECLSGVRPTQGENIGQILRILSEARIEPIQKLVPGLPDDVADLISRMLQRDRAKRVVSLVEAFNVLRRHVTFAAAVAVSEPVLRVASPGSGAAVSLQHRRSVAPSSRDPSATAATLASTTGATTAHRQRLLRGPRRSRALGLGAALATVAVAAAGLTLMVSRRSPSIERPPTQALAAPIASSPPVLPSTPAAAAVAPSAVPDATTASPAGEPPAPSTASSRPLNLTPRVLPARAAPSSSSPPLPAKPSLYEHM